MMFYQYVRTISNKQEEDEKIETEEYQEEDQEKEIEGQTKVLMMPLSPTMEEAKLTKWFKKEGDQVDIGDVIYELETDKVTMEVEAPDKGILSKILIPEGTEGVKVRETVAIITSDEKKETNIKTEEKERKEIDIFLDKIEILLALSIGKMSNKKIKTNDKYVLGYIYGIADYTNQKHRLDNEINGIGTFLRLHTFVFSNNENFDTGKMMSETIKLNVYPLVASLAF